MDMLVSYSQTGTSADPNVFGPPLWFCAHNGAVMYPKNPTPYVKQVAKSFILGFSLLIACTTCKEHYYTILKKTDLDYVVSSRETYFKYWVDVHNSINVKYGKRQISLLEAKALYGYDNPGIGSRVRITYRGIDPSI